MTSIRVQRFIAFLSLTLLAAKLYAWHITGSVAILTDALESIVNVVTGFFGLYSVTLANRPRDFEHPYGHSKMEYISASVEGTLIIVAGFAIIYEAILRILYPEPIQNLDYGIGVTFITGTINLLAGLYAIKIGKQEKSITVESAGKHICSDAYSTYAIILGLLIMKVTGIAWIDSAVAIIFGAFIIATGIGILRKSVGGILDATDKKLVAQVISILQDNRQPYWIDCHNLRILELGDVLHFDAHFTLPWYYDVKKADAIVHEVEALISNQMGNMVEMFLHIDACQSYSCKICSMPNCAVRQHPQEQSIAWNINTVWEDDKHGKA